MQQNNDICFIFNLTGPLPFYKLKPVQEQDQAKIITEIYKAKTMREKDYFLVLLHRKTKIKVSIHSTTHCTVIR